MPAKGYYSLIQYCPDLSRLEAANVGVLLFCPDLYFLRARAAHGNDRIRRFFGSSDADLARINAMKDSLAHRIETEARNIRSLEQLRLFISTRANQLQLTDPRPIAIDDPERQLAELFQRLVGGRTRTPRSTAVNRRLFELFTQSGVASLIQRDVPVAIPVTRTTRTVPFGYQNGRLNLVQPLSFQNATAEAIFTRASRYAVEGDSLYRAVAPGLGPMQLVVVADFPSGTEPEREIVGEILTTHSVKVFDLENPRPLIADIQHGQTARGLRL